jgi:hypothetical protein
LSTDLANREQIETLITQIEAARRAFRTERKQPHPLNTVFSRDAASSVVSEELRAALDHARTALTMTGSSAGGLESAKLRFGWAAARLKRADDRLKQR